MFVCLCKAISEKRIRLLIARGATTLDAIQQECLAGTSCGTCVCTIEDLIRESEQQDEDEQALHGDLAAAGGGGR